MIVEVQGIGLPNKGAELMLVAVKQAILSKYPNAQFVVDPYTDFIERSRHGLWQKLWLTKFGYQLGFFGKYVPKGTRRKFGLITDEEVDVVLDASGFAYGDQWGADKAKERLLRYLPRWNKAGKTVILLPQALGPFENPELNSYMKQIVEKVDLVFARDDISRGYLASVSQGEPMQCPDFTNLVTGTLPADFDPNAFDVCVIPNAKMIEMTDSSTGSSYAEKMAQAIKMTQKCGRRPYLLVHEGIGDLRLAEAINTHLEQPVTILKFDDPLHIKGVIGTADIVISSRFHGLVSALSQGVPALATGWSHKYQMLMQDYGCPDLLVDHNKDEFLQRLQGLLELESYSNYKNEIAERSAGLKKQAISMWQQVFDCIDSKRA